MSSRRSKTSSPKRRALLRVVRWVIFSVLLTLLPIILGALSLPLNKLPLTFDNTLSHGELLIVSTAIMGEAICDLTLNIKADPIFKISVTGLNFIVFGISCYLFADIVTASACNSSNCSASATGRSIDTGVVILYSAIVFIWTLIVGLGCKLVTEK